MNFSENDYFKLNAKESLVKTPTFRNFNSK